MNEKAAAGISPAEKAWADWGLDAPGAAAYAAQRDEKRNARPADAGEVLARLDVLDGGPADLARELGLAAMAATARAHEAKGGAVGKEARAAAHRLWAICRDAANHAEEVPLAQARLPGVLQDENGVWRARDEHFAQAAAAAGAAETSRGRKRQHEEGAG